MNRKIYGRIILPVNAPTVNARLILVELHDVSLLNAPSRIIAHQRLSDVPIHPLAEISFEVFSQEVSQRQRLSLRAHINLAGSGKVAPGDLVTMRSYPVANSGNHGPIDLLVQVV